MSRSKYRFIVALALILLIAQTVPFHSGAATSSDFSNANLAISQAFSATNSADSSGGNVSLLVTQLNSALALVQKAQSENASNPTQASIDLQSAVKIAQQVSSEAPQIGQSGAQARGNVETESIAGIFAIAIAGILVYIYGGRIYRMIWLYAYRNHFVRRENG